MEDKGQMETNVADYTFFCEKCGWPEPCRRRACIDAFLSDADYQEGKISND
jgi:hypothetical protein